MKVTSSDLLAILRRFAIAGEDNVPRHIEQVKTTHPSAINQLVSFRFNRSYYYALFDETADDRAAYIEHELHRVNSNLEGSLLENPTSELSTYGLPFKGKDVYLFREESGKKRLDLVLAERYPDTSRSTWQKHIKAGHISVNGVVATQPKQEITEADSLELKIPDGSDFSELELPILYMDDDAIVVNKPAGVLTHSKGALNDEFTVAEFFRRYTTVGLDTNRPGIVHRLDRDTSGVIIGARTPEAYALLKSQFADRKAGKYYIAITDHVPTQTEANVDIPIGRNPSAPSTFRADSKGKPAITEYHVLAARNGRALVALHPLTGRTHQLRVHLNYLGTPIHGDRVYGGKPADRLYLHAYRLEITIGPDDRRKFVAPLPPAFKTFFPEAQHDIASR